MFDEPIIFIVTIVVNVLNNLSEKLINDELCRKSNVPESNYEWECNGDSFKYRSFTAPGFLGNVQAKFQG